MPQNFWEVKPKIILHLKIALVQWASCLRKLSVSVSKEITFFGVIKDEGLPSFYEIKLRKI
jgi:hypothetical protein